MEAPQGPLTLLVTPLSLACTLTVVMRPSREANESRAACQHTSDELNRSRRFPPHAGHEALILPVAMFDLRDCIVS